MAKNIYMKLLVLALFLSAAMQVEAKCDWYKMSPTWTYTVNGGTIAASNNLAKYPCVQSFWSLAGATAIKGNNITYKVTKNGVYKLCMKLYDTCNRCDTIICKEIKVDGIKSCQWYKMNTNWSASVAGGKITVGLNIANYPCVQEFWSLAGGSYTKATSTSYTVTKNGVYNICMKLYDTCLKCDTLICKEIKVDGIKSCNVDFMAEITKDGVKFKPIFACNGKAVYSWKFGNGTFSNNADPFVKFAKGTYEVCLTAKCYTYDQINKRYDSCEAKICKKIVVKANPCELKGDFYFKVGDKNMITFVGYANEQNLLYYWTIDNIERKGRDFSLYLSPGTHKVCMTIYNPKTGCKITVCKTIEIPQPKLECKVDFTAEITKDGVKFKPSFPCNGTATYYWKFGNGTFSNNFYPFVKYVKGKYEVCLYAKCKVYNKDKKAYDSCETKICKSIVVKENPCDLKGEFSFKIGANNLVTFIATANQQNLLYEWTINGTTTKKGRDFNMTLSPGTHKVCVTIYNPKTGCKTTVCKTIEIPQPKLECKVDFTAEITKDGVKFKPNFPCNGIATYVWKFGNGTFSSNFDPFVKYTKGTYEVCLYAKCKVYNKDKKAYDSCETKICKTIVIKENPCSLKGEFSFKIGASNLVTFIATSNEQNLLYEWTIDGTTSKKGRDFNMTLSQGTHKVCVTIYNPKTNCKIIICKTITINKEERCILPKGWGSSNICTTYNFEGFKAVDGKGTLINNPCHQYSWDFGDKTTATGRLIKHIYAKPGTYKVCMRVVDTCLKCDTSICREIVVKACCNSQINAEFTDSLKLGGIVKFVNTSTGGVYFKWIFGDNTSSTDKNISHTYAVAGSYKVCLVAYDSLKNCTDTFCKTIQVTIKRGSTEAMSITGATKAQWDLYPNPTSDALTISGFNFSNGDIIRIKDIAGKTVLEIYIEKAVTETTLSLEHLVPGIYTIQWQSLAGNSVQSKLIKQ